MANSDDEDWAVRLKTRTAAVRRVRAQYGDGGPPAPDAADRQLSKRVWEKLFQAWRIQVRDSVPAES